MAKGVDKERVKGALLGLAVGDGAGSEAQMAMALSESLVELGGYDPDHALKAYVGRFEAGATGVATTTAAVLEAVSGGAPATEAARRQNEEAAGKAATADALLRATPIALAFAGNEEGIRDATLADAGLTHYDPIAGKSAVFHNHLVSVEVTQGHQAAFASVAEPALHLDERIEEALVPATSGSRFYAERLAREQPGWVIAAFAVGLAALFTADSFEEGIDWALGIEGITNAAAAGALLGARFGLSAIPEERLERLPDRERLEGLGGYLATMAGA